MAFLVLSTQLDYTGVATESACFMCSDPKPMPCVCNLTFNIDTLFKVALELCTNTFTHIRTVMKLNYISGCGWTLNVCFCDSVFLHRDPCSFIMGWQTTSRTTGGTVRPKMITSCLETWMPLRWVDNIGYWKIDLNFYGENKIHIFSIGIKICWVELRFVTLVKHMCAVHIYQCTFL